MGPAWEVILEGASIGARLDGMGVSVLASNFAENVGLGLGLGLGGRASFSLTATGTVEGAGAGTVPFGGV